MANSGNGKLSKLKGLMKRWHSSSRIASAAAGSSSSGRSLWSSSSQGDQVPLGFHPVYVGKSRRQYVVSSDLVHHPLFRVLAERSAVTDDDYAASGGNGGTVLGCEVVLFEHLLWMLENGDPQPELAEFYAC